MELNNQYASVKALGLLATYSWHVLAKALQVLSALQTAALPAQSPQKVVSYVSQLVIKYSQCLGSLGKKKRGLVQNLQ